MKYGWFLRGLKSRLFVRVGPTPRGAKVPELHTVPTHHDATFFDTQAAALAFIDAAPMLKGSVEAVDYAIHPPLPADASPEKVRTRDEVIRDALAADRIKQAQRRANWRLVPRAVAVVFAIVGAFALLGPTPAAASPLHHHRSNHERARRHHPSPVVRDAVRADLRSSDSFMGNVVRGASQAVAIAERYLGGNPTGHASLWCADFANLVLHQLGLRGTGSREARSFLSYGPHTNNPRPGDLVVLARRGGGHVGFFKAMTPRGPLMVAGNVGRRVANEIEPHYRVIAYVSVR